MRTSRMSVMRIVLSALLLTSLTAVLLLAGTVEKAYAAEPEDVVVLHGGEMLTTSATGQGSDPMHTQVVYQLAPDAEGTITFTPDPHNNAVTIIGNGAGNEPNNVTFSIARGINLVIRDLYLRTTDDAYLINFNGITGNSNLLTNQLTLEGTNILEKDAPGGVKSAIHVAPAVDLTIAGNGYLYLDKDGSGAGIGGDGVSDPASTPDASGAVSFGGGNLYLSGEGTGAVVGTGGGGGPVAPGDITIKGGNLNVVTSSSAAGIGGGANSPGGKVVLKGGTTTVTTNGRGSAIGRGGEAATGAAGGTLVVAGGSLKTVMTQAAAVWWGVPAGATSAVITATPAVADDTSVVPGLLAFDTSLLDRSATYFIALADNAPFFRGGLHTESYDIAATGGTLSQWISPQPADSRLYLLLPQDTTRLSVNGEGFTLAWNGDTQTFSCESGEPDDGSLWNGMVDTSWYNTTDTEFWLQNGAQLAGLAQIVNGTAEDIEQDSFTGKTVALLSDIDLNGIEWTPIGRGETTITFTYTNPENGFTDDALTNVIDAESLPFDGTFRGNGKTITGFYIDSIEGLQGLFGYLGSQAEVSRLTVEGTLRTITSLDAVGGLVGFNRGTIDHCTIRVEVIAPSAYNVGGIAGFNDGRTGNGAIRYCANQATVHGYVKVGGITGQNAGLIRSSYNVGDVSGTNASSKNGVGGIAGRNGNNNVAVEVGRIIDCFSICEIGRDGGQRWVGGIAGFQNTLSSVENCYFAGSIPNWSNHTNNPIVGSTDVPALATEMNVNNYALDTIKHSGTEAGEIGIPVTSGHMKSADFIDEINGQDGIGRAFLADLTGDAALNDGYPILRGVHVEDTAVPTGVRIVADPTTHKAEGESHYAYTEGQRFDTKGFLAVIDYSDGTAEKAYDIESSIPRTLSTADTSITLTVSAGGFSASRTYALVVIRDDLVDMWINAQPAVTVYASGERFDTYLLEITVSFSSGARRVLGSEEYTFSPQTLHTGDTEVVVSYVFNGVEKTIGIPVTVLDSSYPEQDENGAYQIEEADDLIWFMARVGQSGFAESDAVLMNDLDMRNTIFAPLGDAGSYVSHFYIYEGTFDGNGKSVTLDMKDTTLNMSYYVGMFKFVGPKGVVKDLTVKGSVQGSMYVGGIAGFCSGRLENCRNEATISGTATAQAHVGGIVGRLEGTAEDCENTGAVSAPNFVGGIAGGVGEPGAIVGATNSGAISAETTLAGGIAGLVDREAVISDAENHGTVTGAYQVGGIVGELRGTGVLSDLKNTGAVSATAASTTSTHAAGGVIGYLSSTGTVERSMNIGPVTGEIQNTGGVVGYLSAGGTVTSCYNGGATTGQSARNGTAVGGVVGAVNNAAATVFGCYNTGTVAHTPRGGSTGTYTSYRGPLIGQYKPTGAIDTTRIGGSYYSVDSSVGLSGIVGGTVVDATTREAARTLLRGITSERVVMLDAGYPIPISLYTGSVANGDVSGDGVLASNDLVVVLRGLVGLGSLSGTQRIAGDIDGDDIVSSADLVSIMRRFVYG